jgi:hypothetical protein
MPKFVGTFLAHEEFHLPLLEVSRVVGREAEKVGTSKGGGTQWQPTPKNLPRMQRARAIPVA